MHKSVLDWETLRSHALRAGTHISPLLHGHRLPRALNPHLGSYFGFWDSGSTPGTAEQDAGDQVELSAESKPLQEYHHTRVRGLYW